MAKQKKLLIDFVHDFIHDEKVRCRTLRDELKGPTDYGLDAAQVATVTTFDMVAIFAAMRDEVLALGINLKKKKTEIGGGGGGGAGHPTPAAAAAVGASMYASGEVHIRRVEVGVIEAGKQATLTILGNGFDKNPQIGFSKGAESQTPQARGKVVKSSCDVDLYQRLTVKVTLKEPGTWIIQGRNSNAEAWNAKTAGVGKVVVQ